MIKDHIKLIAVGAVALIIILGVGGVSYQKLKAASGHALELEEQLALAKEEAAAFNKYLEYLPQAKQSLVVAADKLTTTVEDEVTWVERGERGVSPFKIDANAVLKLSVAYTFGFELATGKFDLVAEDRSIRVKVGQPKLLGSPVVTVVSTEYVSKSLLVTEDAATQEIVRKVTAALEEKASEFAQNDAIRIIVEKKVVEHLRDYFSKQKDIRIIPDMVVSAS